MEGFGGWYEDFWRLSTERQFGFGVGPIPQGRIDEHVAGWRYDDAEMFEHCIRELDGVYMKRQNKADDAPTAPGSPMDAFRGATAGRRGR